MRNSSTLYKNVKEIIEKSITQLSKNRPCASALVGWYSLGNLYVNPSAEASTFRPILTRRAIPRLPPGTWGLLLTWC